MGPKADKLETIISFALSVENLCATMETSGLISYLQNPSLLKELVDKLPAQMRLNWALYKSNFENVTITTFSSWIAEIAEAACEVVHYQTVEPKRSDSKNEKNSTKRNEYLNTHVNDSSHVAPSSAITKNLHKVHLKIVVFVMAYVYQSVSV